MTHRLIRKTFSIPANAFIYADQMTQHGMRVVYVHRDDAKELTEIWFETDKASLERHCAALEASGDLHRTGTFKASVAKLASKSDGVPQSIRAMSGVPNAITDIAMIDDVARHAKLHPAAQGSHACADWDYLVICRDCPEYDFCTCPLGPKGA